MIFRFLFKNILVKVDSGFIHRNFNADSHFHNPIFFVMHPPLATIDIFYFISAITIATFGFLTYFFLSGSPVIKRMLKTAGGESLDVLFQRFLGFLIFGIIPLIIISFPGSKSMADFGVIAPVPGTYYWTIFLSVVILIITWFNSRTPVNLEMYPQIRNNEWTVSLLIVSGVSWIAYLCAYEFLFRGFLLFSSLILLGLWPAIILNTAIYALVHLPKGFKETLGAIPLGVLLCYLTYLTGSIWIAVFTHIVMALSNEWFSLRVHPQMYIKTLRK